MIYLGLDYGEKRIGVACSDELARFADPFGLITYRTVDEIWQKICDCVSETHPDAIVVGLPRRTTGELKSEAIRVIKFTEELKTKVTCPVVTWDERFTTKEADRVLREGNVGWRKRKEKRDALAAAIMLQSYLDFQRLGKLNVSNDEVAQ